MEAMGKGAPVVMLLLGPHVCGSPTSPASSADRPDVRSTMEADSLAAGDGNAAGRTVDATTPPVRGAPIGLELDASWPFVVSPIGAARDGRGWIGAGSGELLVHDGAAVAHRFPLVVDGSSQLAALPDGGWIAGPQVLDPDGRVRFDGHGWCNRVGRFGICQAAAFSSDGTVAILAASDSPSTCLRDRDCGSAGSWRGVLARMTFGSEPAAPTVRTLIEHEDRQDFVVAASERWVAAVDGRELWVWPAVGDDAPSTVTLEDAPSEIAWVGDDLVGTRWLDTEHSEVVVLDGRAGYARSARWTVEGRIDALAARPGTEEIAIGTTWYRARETVEVDDKRVEIWALDGTRTAHVELEGWPASLAWSPSGEALFVAMGANDPVLPMVMRFSLGVP